MRRPIQTSICIFCCLLLHIRGYSQTCNSDWLYIPSQPGYVSVGDLDIPGNSITIEALFVRTQPYSHILYAGDLVSKHSQSSDVNYLLRPSTAEITTTNGYFITSEICELELNRLYHVAMVYDGAHLKLYRDGLLISQVEATGDLIQNDWQTRIGFYQAAVYPENLLGYINEVRIWNVVRTQEQIAAGMTSSIPDPASQNGLLAYYRFDNLQNKQGNPAWNGTLGGSASLGASIPNCNFDPFECPRLVDTSIINSYTPVSDYDLCINGLTVQDASSFRVGDTVLLIQMKGASIDETNTSLFGDISSYGNAGHYEFNYIERIDGNKIELRNALIKSYDYDVGKVQLIRVPYFEELSTVSVLTCLPWDGEKGGVLVFNVGNTLTLNEDVDVSGRGYRGGTAITNPNFACNTTDFVSSTNNGSRGGRKGEGIFNTTTLLSGRGKLANGGGGGNSTNSGGAGGGNAGAGGAGGNQFIGCGVSNFVNGGVGGLGFDYSADNNRVFMGAGGGAGHQNDVPALGSGGNGGGIVIFSCNTLVTNGHKVLSEGATPPHLTGTNDDGKSGGGAGGSVLLSYASIVGDLQVSVKGGDGDFCAPPAGDLHGPGGGGGGGLIWVSSNVPGPNLTLNTSAGVNGTNVNVGNNPWGATAGQPGQVLTNLQLPYATVPHESNIDSVKFNFTQPTCSSAEFIGTAYLKVGSIAGWHWDFGDGSFSNDATATHDFTTPGTYTVKLVVTDIFGCKDSLSRLVEIGQITAEFTYSLQACDPNTVVFNGNGFPGNSNWDFGDGATVNGQAIVSHTFPDGNFSVLYISGASSCADTIQKTITTGTVWGDIILTPDTSICVGTDKLLRGVMASDFCWQPTDYLANSNTHQPTTSTPADIVYYYTALVRGVNLITNGDFEMGNSGFTSAYQFSTSTGDLPGSYTVASSAAGWSATMAPCTDHSTGSGNMLLVNGSTTAGDPLWSQTIPVDPNTYYSFSGFVQNLSATNPPSVLLLINGEAQAPSFQLAAETCLWQNLSYQWHSGNNTEVVLQLVNSLDAGAGNDFAVDDLEWNSLQFQRDSVRISVESPVVRANADSTICYGTSLQLSATGADTYVWTPAAFLDNSQTANPVATPAVSTQFIVAGTTTTGCIARDTVVVSIHDLPQIALSNDTSICRNTSVQLFVSGGQSYYWSPSASLNDSYSSTPIASPNAETTYFVEITDANACLFRDSVVVAIRPDAVFTLSGPTSICYGDSLQLIASGGNQYSWTPNVNLSAIDVANPVVWPTSSTDYYVTITELTCNESETLSTHIEVLPNPTVTASRSNDIDCTVSQSQLTANGALRYSWTPSSTLSDAAIRNPVASPRETTWYVVKGEDAAGCSGYDTVQVKVEKINESQYLVPNAFTPNNDGLNDCFGIKFWGVVEELEFSIYNRWGERIFFSKDPNACWDGTYRGVKQDAGVFVYMLRARTSCTENVFRKGTFVLIR